MRPRPPRPRRRDQLFARALQWARLEMLMRGEAEPHGPREALFVAALAAGERPDPSEFILSATLLRAEAMALQAARPDHGDGDDADPAGP